MNAVRKKLNNQDGVSILIALVGFMIAAMISIVIVTAAVTAAERVANDKTETQAHLTLESAAQIVQDGIEATEYKYNDDGDAETSGMFAAEMEAAIGSLSAAGGDYSSGTDPVCTVSLGASDTVKDVNVSFVMGNGNDGSELGEYDLRFTLSIDGADEEIYISADGSCTSQKDDNGMYTITWTVVSINGLGA